MGFMDKFRQLMGIPGEDDYDDDMSIIANNAEDEEREAPVTVSRRGNVLGMEARNGAQQIDANVPLANMFGYATDLRSKTQGRGQYAMEPSHYIELPKSLQEELVAKRNKG